ncbi:MAG: PaaI family thioesterase [Deltaproteobacteria bacterium]|nr:PaaI family thioesterase [Deltaproteobacteria bacterium]
MSSAPDLSGLPGWTPVPSTHELGHHSYVASDPRLGLRCYVGEDQDVLFAKVWFGPDVQGPPGVAHGGSMAAVLDELMGLLAWRRGFRVVAVGLNTRFRKMLPLGAVVTARAEVQEVDGRKLFVRSTLVNDAGEVHAEGENVFLSLMPDQLAKLEANRAARQHGEG